MQRLQGRAVTFVTGTDEHGEKISLAAAALGRSPREHVDIVAQEYKSLWAEVIEMEIKMEPVVTSHMLIHELAFDSVMDLQICLTFICR